MLLAQACVRRHPDHGLNACLQVAYQGTRALLERLVWESYDLHIRFGRDVEALTADGSLLPDAVFASFVRYQSKFASVVETKYPGASDSAAAENACLKSR
jgi:hypothetical protein